MRCNRLHKSEEAHDYTAAQDPVWHWRNSVSNSGGLPWWYGDVLIKFWGVANVLQPPPQILRGCNPLTPRELRPCRLAVHILGMPDTYTTRGAGTVGHGRACAPHFQKLLGFAPEFYAPTSKLLLAPLYTTKLSCTCCTCVYIR
jgi:hypothetical protein